MDNNILVLLVDQWPADCFGHRGADIKTPHMDKLADEGVVFTNAFTTCPLCSPARGALFTARWHHQSGMTDNMGIGYSLQQPLSLSERTWLDAGVSSDYHLGYYGKWHLGADGPIERGVHRHPESIEGHFKPYEPKESDYSFTKWQKKYEADGKVIIKGKAPYYGTTNSSIEDSNPFVVASQANKFLDEYDAMASDKPFFLTVSINDPHFPHYLPEAYVAANKSPEIPLPINLNDAFENKPDFQNKAWWPSMEVAGLDDEGWKEVIRFAYTHRMMVDDALGSVLDKLEALQLGDKTTVVFVSDHGDMCGAHNRFDKGPYFYDEVWRIPLIVKQPGNVHKVEEAMVSILDVGATIFDLAEGVSDQSLAGKSLLPFVKGSGRADDWKDEVYGMYDNYNGMSFRIRAVRDADYKYVYNPQSVDELYDLNRDCGELENLIGKKELMKVQQLLQKKLQDWMRDIEDPLLDEIEGLPEAGTIVVLDKPGP